MFDKCQRESFPREISKLQSVPFAIRYCTIWTGLKTLTVSYREYKDNAAVDHWLNTKGENDGKIDKICTFGCGAFLCILHFYSLDINWHVFHLRNNIILYGNYLTYILVMYILCLLPISLWNKIKFAHCFTRRHLTDFNYLFLNILF